MKTTLKGDHEQGVANNEVFNVREAVARGAEFLRNKGIATARLDSELLVGEATGLSRLQLYLNLERPLHENERAAARELLKRRAAREPVAYILGRREFCSRVFEVNPSVLIPRPETELLVEHAEAQLKARFGQPGDGGDGGGGGAWRVLEFGVGSGAVAVSLAADLPQARIVATEISPAAAEVARRNAQRHGVDSRVDIRVQGDFSGIEGPFHALVSNPPYIARSEQASLPPEVARYEPEQALYAEEEGTAALAFLLRQAPRLLAPGGFLLCEIGFAMAERVRALAVEAQMRPEAFFKDYAGIERIVLAVPQTP